MKRIVTMILICCIMVMYIPAIAASSEIEKIEFKKEFEDREESLFSTVLSGDDAKVLIGDGAVFTTKGDTFYACGMKMRYSTYDVLPVEDKGVFMLPAEFLLSALDKNGTKNGDTIYVDGISFKVDSDKIYTSSETLTMSAKVTNMHGKIYVPVKDVCELGFSLFTYSDERGYIFIDDEEITYTNSPSCFDVNEEVDTIYRFLQFDRPSAKKVFKEKDDYLGNVHPRIMTNTENLNETKKLISTDSRFDRMLQMLIFTADSMLDASCVEKVYVGSNILDSARAVVKRVEILSSAYLITGEKKYAEKCIEEMKNVCSWTETKAGKGAWNEYGHYLDVSEITYAVALGYDSVYDCLSDADKKFIAQKVYENSLVRAIDVYGGNYDGAPWCKSASNWSFVCAGALVAACIAFGGDGYEEYEDTYDFLLTQAMHSLEYPIMGFYPDGVWIEGGDYWNYSTLYMCKAALAPLYFSCGTDFGLLDAEGVSETMESVLMLQSGAEGGFNYSDGSQDKQAGAQAFLISRILGDSGMSEAWYKNRRSVMTVTDSSWATGFEIFWYRPTDVQPDENIVTDKYFHGADIGFMREKVDASNGAFVGIKAGESSHLHHSHLDLGSFIFGDEGQRFAIDLGKDNYNIAGGYWGYYGYTLYRKRPEGHNLVVINPRADISSEYYGGQYADAYATLIEDGFKSSAAEAYMAIDLGNAYKYDTSSYIRGYFFGDNRKSLLVQDEMSLLEDNSEIYWFMHTKATIQIDDDGKGATLTQGGKTLRVKALCDANQWHFEVRDAKPFDTSPVRDGQNANVGISKLTLVAKGSGNVKIAVKMMCGNDFEMDKITPISSWSVDENSRQNIVFNNIFEGSILNADKLIPVEVYIPESFKSASLLADGKIIATLAEESAGTKKFLISPENVTEGKREIKAEITDENGKTRQSDGFDVWFIKYDNLSDTNKTKLDFEKCDFSLTNSSDIVRTEGSWWQLHENASFVGICEGNGGGKALKVGTEKPLVSAKPYVRIMHGLYTGSGGVSSIKNQYIEMIFDLYASETFAEVRVAGRESGGGTLFACYPFSPDGVIGNTNIKYEKEKWYSFRLCADIEGKNYYVYCGDNLIASGKLVGKNFQYVDFTYGSCYGGKSYMALDNVQVYYRKKTANKVYATSSVEVFEGNAAANISAYATGAKEVTLFVAEYSADGEKLLNIYKKDLNLSYGENNLSYTVPADGNNKYKAVTLIKNSLTPIGPLREQE